MLFGQGRFAGRSTQHAVDRVGGALLRLVEMPHLQLAQESKSHQLDTGNDQHRAKHHHRPVLVHYVDVADEFFNDHPECNQESGDRTDGTETSKEVQRTRHVFEQETDGDQVEKYAEGAADPVMRLTMLAAHIANGYLTDGRAVDRRQRGNKPMQFPVKWNFLQDVAAIGLERGAEIMDIDATQLGHQ